MKQEIAELWAKDLIEGGHLQTQSSLRHRDSFCCLGRLCDLHSKTEKGTWRRTEGGNLGYLPKGQHGVSDLMLPTIVGEWAGIPTPTASFQLTSDIVTNSETPRIKGILQTTKRNHLSLAFFNDTGVPFKEIGHFILLNWRIL